MRDEDSTKTRGNRAAVLTNSKSPPIVVNPKSIPDEIKNLRRWVCWKWAWSGKKWTKPPVQLDGRTPASSTNPTTWSSFDDALESHHREGIGIGFVLNGDGIVGIDLDDCRNPETGELAGWARDIIDRLATYCEISPSGTGVKLLVRATLRGVGGKQFPRPGGDGEVEVYATGRYWTITGQRLPDSPNEIRANQIGLDDVIDTLQSWRQKRESNIAPRSNGEHEKIRAALAVLDPDCSYSDWIKIGQAIHAHDASASGLAEWDGWSRRGQKYVANETAAKWETFHTNGGVTLATLYHLADGTGRRWRSEQKLDEKTRCDNPERKSVQPEVKIVCVSDIERKELAWLWPNRVPAGKLTLLCGDPGLGKSHLTVDIAARTTRGGVWPDGSAVGASGSVIIFSAEDDAADTIRPRLERANADLSKCFLLESVKVFDVKSQEYRHAAFDLNEHVPILEEHVNKLRDVRLIIIDPISAYAGRVDSHKNAEVRAMLVALTEMAARNGIAILAVTHLTKNAGGRAVYRATGSLAFAAAARAVWMVAPDLDDPRRRLLLPVKANLAAEASGLAFTIMSDWGGSFVAWEPGPVAMTADGYLKDEAKRAEDKRREDDPSTLDRAVDFLRDALEGGAMLSSEIYRAAKENGIKTRSLERALDRVGVKARKRADGKWEKYIPDASSPRQDRQNLSEQILGDVGDLGEHEPVSAFSF